MNSKIKILNQRIDDVNDLGKSLLGDRGIYAGDNPTTYQIIEAIEQIPQLPYKEIKSIKYVKTEDKRDVLEITLFKEENQDDEQVLEIELEFEGANIKSFKNGLLTWNAEYQNNKLTKISDTNIDLSQYFVLGYGSAPGEGVDDPESENYDEDYINDNGKPLEAHGITFYTGPGGEIFKMIIAPVGDTIHSPAENPTPYEGHVFVGWYDQSDPDKEIVQFPVKDVHGEKVYIAKYEKKYVDALYKHFELLEQKEKYPYICISIGNGTSYILFSESVQVYTDNYGGARIYAGIGDCILFWINIDIEDASNIKEVCNKLFSANYGDYTKTEKEDATIKDNIYINLSSSKYIYTNKTDLSTLPSSIVEKWEFIY